MRRAVFAGLAYFAVVFAAGFILGSIRTIFLAPKIGELAAVVLETPLMLAISWVVCRRLIEKFDVPSEIFARAAMGATALCFLLACEVALSVFAFGATPLQWVASLGSPPGATGLAGQLLFAAFPLLAISKSR